MTHLGKILIPFLLLFLSHSLFAQTANKDSLVQKQTQLTEQVNKLKATLESSEAELKIVNAKLAPPAPKWTHKGLTGFSLSQTSFSNWSAGGENSVVGTIYLNGELNYTNNNWLWNNSLNTIYGRMYSPVYGWYKADDNFNISSKLGYALTKSQSLYASFLVNFQTQYAQGRTSPSDANYISTFMAPGYLNLAAGLDYKPWKWFSLFASPINGRLTFVEDDYLASINAFGIGAGKKFDASVGFLINNAINVNLMKNMSLISKLDLFTAYDNTFGNVVVNWDVLFAMKVSKYITTTVNLGVKYDDKVKTTDSDGVQHGPKIQLKEMIGIGLSYSF